MKTFVLALCLAAVVVADNTPRPQPRQSYQPQPQPQPRQSYQPQQQQYADAPAQYSFNWAVKDDYSGNDFGQNEERNGDQTSGTYYVALPDGRLQRVTYTVDAYNGYQADVTYEGEAQYPPAPEPKQQNSYAPRPAPQYSNNRF